MPWRVVRLAEDSATGRQELISRLYPSQLEAEAFRSRELADPQGKLFCVVETDDSGRSLDHL